ncbi:MAG TPA: aspartate 1-decarboxylase, partial [Rhodothermales bacterium]
ITLDEALLEASGILPFEKVQVVNVNNGSRLETYTIPGRRDSGIVCLNGPAARLAVKGDEVIVISYAQLTPEEARDLRPRVVLVDESNVPTEIIDLGPERRSASDQPVEPDVFSA